MCVAETKNILLKWFLHDEAMKAEQNYVGVYTKTAKPK